MKRFFFGAILLLIVCNTNAQWSFEKSNYEVLTKTSADSNQLVPIKIEDDVVVSLKFSKNRISCAYLFKGIARARNCTFSGVNNVDGVIIGHAVSRDNEMWLLVDLKKGLMKINYNNDYTYQFKLSAYERDVMKGFIDKVTLA